MAEDTPDEVFVAALEAVAPQQWAALWEAVDAVAAEAEHATWAGGEVVRTTIVDGVERPVRQMPYPVYSEAVERLRSLVGELGLVVVFDWMHWDGTKRHSGGEGLAEAPAADAVRMITAVFRAERFADGAIDGKLTDGTLPAAFARLRRWHAEHAAGATATTGCRSRTSTSSTTPPTTPSST